MAEPVRRLRIDSVIAAIEKGDYDDRINDLQKAIEVRIGHRKDAVIKLVKEVFGEQFSVSELPMHRVKTGRNIFLPETEMERVPLSPESEESEADLEASMEIENRGSKIVGAPDFAD